MVLPIPRVKLLGWVDDEILDPALLTQMDLNISLLDSVVDALTIPIEMAINWPERATSGALFNSPAANNNVALAALDRGAAGLVLLSLTSSKDVVISVDGGATWYSTTVLANARITKPEMAVGLVDGVPTVAIPGTPGNFYKSTDGVTWAAPTGTTPPDCCGAYSSSLNRWAFVGGLSITTYVPGTAAGFSSIGSFSGSAPASWQTNSGGCKRLVWNGSIFVALPVSIYDKCLVSADGITWTEQSLGLTSLWTGLAYSDIDGLWIASSSGVNISKSVDGLTWVGSAIAVSGLGSTDLAAHGRVWVMVTTSGAYGGVAYSVNAGASWTPGPAVGNHTAATAGWNRILAADNRFIVAHQTGSANTEYQLSLRAP